MTARKGFNFYLSYWEQMKLLNDKQKVLILKAICEVQFLEKNIKDISFKDNMCNLVWAGIKHSVKTSLDGFINKSKSLGSQVIEPLAKGGGNGGGDTPRQQEQEQVKGKEEVQVQVEYIPPLTEFLDYCKQIKEIDFYSLENSIKLKYQSWVENGWKDGKNNKIKNWKTKILNTVPYMNQNSQQKRINHDTDF